MPLSRRVVTCLAGSALLAVAAPGCATQEVPKMPDMSVTVTGDGPDFLVDAAEAEGMAQALRRILADPEAVARSRAPLPLQQSLMRDYAPDPLMLTERVYAGEWLLVSADTGPRWDLRMVDPGEGRMGLMFRVPLQRDDRGNWHAVSVTFLRVR